MYKLTFVVTTYNEENIILRCLKSIVTAKGDNKDIRIMVVDDGSTDNTEQLVSNSCYDVDYYKFDNGGLSEARNRGITLASKDSHYISFVDADDMIESTYVDEFLRAYEFAPDFIEIGVNVINENKGFSFHIGNGNDKLNIVDSNYLERVVKQDKWFSWARIYSKNVCSKLVFPVGKYYEDAFAVPIVYMEFSRVYSSSKFIYNYIIRDGSITMSPKLAYVEHIVESLSVFDDFHQDHLKKIRKDNALSGIFSIVSRLSVSDGLQAYKFLRNSYSGLSFIFQYFLALLKSLIRFTIFKFGVKF